MAQHKQLEVELEAPDVLTITNREAILKTALTNLLSNAIKFSPVSGRVQVSISQTTSIAIVRIEDSGAGLTPDQIQRLGERFFRADSNTPGTGLGWSIVRQCVEMLQGMVRVSPSSALGGLLVELRLPI
jgi:two-component system sensor histidine kinase QseC